MKTQYLFIILFLGLLLPEAALAETANTSNSGANPSFSINVGSGKGAMQDTSTAVKLLLGLTVLSLAPAILIMLTSFTRIIIVLSMLRHAFGMQQTPPNTVLISLALFLTLFSMTPVFDAVNTNALQPYLSGTIKNEEAFKKGMKPLREFMIKQTREKDLLLIIELAKAKKPRKIEEIENSHLISAFMLSELKTAFQIGFVILIPFLLIDLIVASTLMSMGMIMVPPMMISLPVKILMFVLIDGWALVTYSLMSSF
jgi:flagellar biosynthetic protein FliP